MAMKAESIRSPLDPDLRERLDLEHLVPHPRLVEVGEQLVEVRQRDPGEPWARRRRPARRSSTHAPRRGRRRRGRGRCRAPHAGGASTAATRRRRMVGEPAPVPAGEDELERGLDALPEVEPAREPLRHLAHGRERVAGPRPRVRDRVLDQRSPNLRRTPGPDVRLVEGRAPPSGLVVSMRKKAARWVMSSPYRSAASWPFEVQPEACRSAT